MRSNRLFCTPTRTLFGALALATLVPLSARAALQGRNLDGNPATFEAYFDTTLNITWLADATYGATAGLPNLGRLNWAAANTYVTNLNVNGVTGWRLPKTAPSNGATFNLAFSTDGSSDRGYANQNVGWGTASEMGQLFYVTLGNAKFNLTNTGPFLNLAANDYWTKTANPSDATSAFSFNFGGLQDVASKTFTLGVWAVRDGDVAAVPEPQSLALILGGLAVLGQLVKRRRLGLLNA